MKTKLKSAYLSAHGSAKRVHHAAAKAVLLFLCVALLGMPARAQSDLELTGSNSWVFHTPDDGRTTLYIAPKLSTGWYWGAQTQFLNNGSILVSGSLGVGLGTDQPTSKIDIRQTGVVNGTSTTIANFIFQGENHFNGFTEGRLTFSSQAFGNGRLKKAELGYATSGNYGMGGALRFYTSPDDESFTPQMRMILDHNGNVGIGTENPNGFRLSVNGKVRAKEVRVESNWADFVFEPGYKLRPLEEVEQYIKEHGHLPDIPSAQEVKENGVDLGNTDALLLQKIEELTLYLIELKRENSELRRQNAEILQKLGNN